MAEWEQVAIGEIAKHRKGSIVIRDDAEYKLCRVQLHRRGIVLRETLRGAEIKTKKQQLCHTNDLVVAEMDAKFGGYGFITDDLDGAIVSSHYYLFELDSTKVYRNYFQVLIHSGVIQNQIEAKGSTNYSSIRAWEFLDYSVPLPDLQSQRAIAKRFFHCYDGKKGLDNQSEEQLSLLGKLRQAVLQEAIEGKLTAEWRKQNPKLISGENHASKLLERIRAEKERLIKEGKMKKGKKQLPSNRAELLLSIPSSWEYPDLDDITKLITDGTHQTPSYVNSGRRFLSAQNVKPFRFMPEPSRFVTEQAYLDYTKNVKAEKGDLLVGRVGSKGETAVIDVQLDFAFYVSLGLVKTFRERSVPEYLAMVMNSPYGRRFASSNMSSLGASAGNLNLGHIRSFPIPLPPIAEQRVIVERVDSLMTTIDVLEKQVSDRKEQSGLLMQSVLREAFEHSHA